MPALLKLALIFAGIVLLLNRKWNLGLVLLLATAAVGLLFAYPLSSLLRDALLAAVDLLTLRLVVIVVLIMVLGELLRRTASIQRLVESLQALIPNEHIVIAALPALIGLLPMIGGAMFSAPLVDEVGDRLEVNPARKTFVNYWFRHVWEPIFPLYPSMMLGAALLGLTTAQLTAVTWPLTVAALVGGVVFGLLGVPRRSPPSGGGRRREALRVLVESIWPIALVIILSLVLPIDERFTLFISLAATIVLVMAGTRTPPRAVAEILRRQIPWDTVVIIIGALVFQRVLENSGAVCAVASGLSATFGMRVMLPLVAFGAPFIAGALTGLMTAAFGIGFSVALPLLALQRVTPGGEAVAPAWALWLMAGGFLGGMCSPVHLCLALTRVYFKADWGLVYRLLIPAVLLVTVTAGGILWLSR